MGLKSIPGEHIFLETLTKEHIPAYLRSFSEKVQEILKVNTVASERSYLEQRCENEEAFFYVIKDRSTAEIIGAIEIRNAVFRSQLYCWINEHWWGRGYFLDAIKIAIALYFLQTGLQTISARVDCDNGRSFRALQKAGFHSNGIVDGPRGKQFELLLKIEEC